MGLIQIYLNSPVTKVGYFVVMVNLVPWPVAAEVVDGEDLVLEALWGTSVVRTLSFFQA